MPKWVSGQIGYLPHSQLVYGYATNQCSKKQFFDQILTGFEPRTLTCLCYTISSPMLKKYKICCYIKNQKTEQTPQNLYLKTSWKEKSLRDHSCFRRSMIFWKKSLIEKTHLFSPLITKKNLEKSIQLFFDHELLLKVLVSATRSKKTHEKSTKTSIIISLTKKIYKSA